MLLGVKWRGFIALVGCLAAVRPLAALRMSRMEVIFVMWNTLVIGAVASLMLVMTASVRAEGSWCVNKNVLRRRACLLESLVSAQPSQTVTAFAARQHDTARPRTENFTSHHP
jgi:hypothetical protein